MFPLRIPLFTAIVLMAALLLPGLPLRAQPLTTKTVNLESPVPTPVGQIDFPFTHRFSIFGSKVTSSPTFTLSTGLTPRISAALRYATSSDVNATQPGAFNEWEPLLKTMALSQAAGSPFDLTGMLTYNTSASSTDAALVLARQWGAVTLMGTLKGFSNGYGMGTATAVGTGIRWDLTRYLQLSADLNGVTSGRAAGANPPAWSVATTFEIPYSPHTVSLYVTNANTHTLEGTSRGSANLRGGFEFLVPFTSWSRWAAIFVPPPGPLAPEGSPPPTRPMPVPGQQAPTGGPGVPSAMPYQEVTVMIEGLKYAPATVTVSAGTTIRWVNQDTMIHTVTSTAGKWDSGNLQPGASWSMRFDEAGTYPYLCTPHPFMTGTVEVRP
jgi:plastocyanin